MDEIIEYIKQFLVYGNEEAAGEIGYTSDESEWDQYKLVIVPGKNILTGEKREWTEPNLQEKPQAEKTNEFVDEMGEKTGGTWVIREDIIYNTLFCISLAGEFCLPYPDQERDEHGRIPSKYTPLGKQGLRTIPVLDEYSRLCTKLLEASLPKPQISRIVLSHDVDTIANYRHLRGFLGGIKRGHISQAFASLVDLENDPAYTFPWLHDQDSRVENAEELYFIKAGNGKGYDYPQYNLHGNDYKVLMEHLKDMGATVGLHGSYAADSNLAYHEEKKRLEEAWGAPITCHRSHYLHLTNAKAMQVIADAGIKDDYTMGWADHIGLRMGTTRSVRWINPETLQLTPLTLHPLCVMDCSLSNSQYMNIPDEEEAYYTCQQLIDKIRQHGGELVLLWHNSNLEATTYHKKLYQEIIEYLSE